MFGQALLLGGMVALIVRQFPAQRFMSFEFCSPRRLYPSLMLVGLLYNVGVWADKIVFWYTAETSHPVIGPLRASLVYDFPVFLAYLSVIPGMAVLLLRIEATFAACCEAFYDAVRHGRSLATIEALRNEMVSSVRAAVDSMIKIQTIAALLVIAAGEPLLRWLDASPLHLPLLIVQVIAAGLQVVLLAILTVLFYLDRRVIALSLCAAFAALNVALTSLSIALGPMLYGYGFASALLLVVLTGLFVLSRKLDRLEFETFMCQ